MMKKLSFYLAVFVLTIGFANADVSKNNNKLSESTNCPYLNSIVNSGDSIECPYLSNKSKVENKCPYSEEKISGTCPYNDEMKEGNLRIEKKNKPEIEIKSS
jgi:hypothetical protein